ncbi:hypothetical protein B0H13DRAFT_1873944 [Mycena leptocephala]|nr:hypothetical protein B0H13DRAFT_1873944 [Mycena leptocephala]
MFGFSFDSGLPRPFSYSAGVAPFMRVNSLFYFDADLTQIRTDFKEDGTRSVIAYPPVEADSHNPDIVALIARAFSTMNINLVGLNRLHGTDYIWLPSPHRSRKFPATNSTASGNVVLPANNHQASRICSLEASFQIVHNMTINNIHRLEGHVNNYWSTSAIRMGRRPGSVTHLCGTVYCVNTLADGEFSRLGAREWNRTTGMRMFDM